MCDLTGGVDLRREIGKALLTFSWMRVDSRKKEDRIGHSFCMRQIRAMVGDRMLALRTTPSSPYRTQFVLLNAQQFTLEIWHIPKDIGEPMLFEPWERPWAIEFELGNLILRESPTILEGPAARTSGTNDGPTSSLKQELAWFPWVVLRQLRKGTGSSDCLSEDFNAVTVSSSRRFLSEDMGTRLLLLYVAAACSWLFNFEVVLMYKERDQFLIGALLFRYFTFNIYILPTLLRSGIYQEYIYDGRFGVLGFPIFKSTAIVDYLQEKDSEARTLERVLMYEERYWRSIYVGLDLEHRRSGIEDPSALMVYNVLGMGEEDYVSKWKAEVVAVHPELGAVLPVWSEDVCGQFGSLAEG
ncbi:hypothetical protein BDQ17DRAFT_1332534 [Cyathus striatus]|nr:hypothetical protein BDQ17DRAFT_1332534 [Cyathus striatus]